MFHNRFHNRVSLLHPQHPAEAPDCSADLPIPLAITWTPQVRTCTDLLKACKINKSINMLNDMTLFTIYYESNDFTS